jgi:hypothetical protein
MNFNNLSKQNCIGNMVQYIKLANEVDKNNVFFPLILKTLQGQNICFLKNKIFLNYKKRLYPLEFFINFLITRLERLIRYFATNDVSQYTIRQPIDDFQTYKCYKLQIARFNQKGNHFITLIRTILSNYDGILEWDSQSYLNVNNQLFSIEPLVVKIIDELFQLETYFKRASMTNKQCLN